MKALFKRLFGAKDTPEIPEVKKYTTYEDLGECAKSLHDLVVNNPKRFQLIDLGSAGILNTSYKVFNFRRSLITYIGNMRPKGLLTINTYGRILLRDKETLVPFSVGTIRANYEESGLCDKVSWEEWGLLSILLLDHYEDCVWKYNQKLQLRKNKQEQRIKKRYTDVVSKLYCTCESKL